MISSASTPMQNPFRRVLRTLCLAFIAVHKVAEKIGSYLTVQDRLFGRLVCKDWNIFLVNSAVAPDVSIIINEDEKQLDKLASSDLSGNWNSFIFKNVGSIRSPTFWNYYGNLITEIKFLKCQNLFAQAPPVSETTKLCPNLRHLALSDCDISLMLGSDKFCLSEWICLENLETLDVSDNGRYLSDRILFSLLFKTKVLKSLNFSGTGMTFMNVVFQRYYPKWNEISLETCKDLSDNVFTFQALRDGFLCTSRAFCMSELIMDRTNVNGACLESISDPKVYHWKTISLHCCREIKFESLKKFLSVQNLKVLRLVECRQHLTENLEESLQYLTPNIKSLSLRSSNFKSLTSIQHLKNLNNLDIGESLVEMCSQDEDILSSLKDLRILKLDGLTKYRVSAPTELSSITGTLVNVLEKLSFLTVLNLSMGMQAVTDEVVQMIIKNMRCLQVLNLADTAITDLGLAGQLSEKYEEDPMLTPNMILQKREEFESWKTSSETRLCLSLLASLKVLVLANCKYLGEATWEFALNLQYLEKLDLSFVKISQTGLLMILRNCRSLISLQVLQDRSRRNYFLRDENIRQGLFNHPRLNRSAARIFGELLSENPEVAEYNIS